MIINNLIQIGNPILREKSQKVVDFKSDELKTTIQDLTDSMRFHDLVGMAAGQIGRKLRVFITEVRKTKTRDSEEIDKLRIFINPRISWKSREKIVMYEGCGSVAYGKLFGPVKRSRKIIITARNENGVKFKVKAKSLLSRVIQHEYDHLQGIEFTDKIIDFKKIMSREEYIKKFISKN